MVLKAQGIVISGRLRGTESTRVSVCFDSTTMPPEPVWIVLCLEDLVDVWTSYENC